MKVTHVSASLSRAAGGIFEIEVALARNLHELGVKTDVVGLFDDHWTLDYPRWSPLDAKVCPIKGSGKFGYSPALKEHLASTSYDILHLHTLWMYPSIAVHHSAVTKRKPYLVTVNGMLEPWALRNSEWKKKVSGWVYEVRNLSRAACLHANTGKELSDFREFGLCNPVCIVPNGIDVPEIDTETLKTERLKSERKILLFLGRLHPKKGLMNALRAWASLRTTANRQPATDEWQFVIAGWDQGGHEGDLKRLCKELGLSYSDIPATVYVGETPTLIESLSVSSVQFDDGFQSASSSSSANAPIVVQSSSSVIFVGSAFGETKDSLLRQASAFVLPSFSEGLPMSVLEAWSYRLPVLMTDHCNIPEGLATGSAIRIGTDTESIAEGMRVLFSLPTTDNGQPTTSLFSLGQNGRALVERQFTWSQVAAQMKEVYEWVVGGGPRPDSIHGGK